MPAYTSFGQDPTPLAAEAPDVPASFLAYAQSIDKKLNHTVATQAERDARFTGAPAGVYVSCVPLKKIWLSTGYVGGIQGWLLVFSQGTASENALNPDYVHIASSLADRNNTYTGAPAGMLVSCPSLKTMWMSLGTTGSTTTWETVHEDTGWITTGFIYPNAYFPGVGGTAKVRRRDGVIYVQVSTAYDPTGGTGLSFGANGQIIDTLVCRLPSGFAPTSSATAAGKLKYVSCMTYLSTSGDIFITDGTPGQAFEATSEGLNVAYVYPVG